MRLTARGVALVVASVLVFGAGVLLGLPLLRALAGFGAGAVLVAVVPTAGRVRPDITREVHPVRAQRGRPAVARLTVTNRTGQRQPAFVARDGLGDSLREVAIRALAPGSSTFEVYELPTDRRGRIAVGPLVVERSDLLGLARSRGEVGAATDMWVYPRRHPVRLPGTGRARHHHVGEPPAVPVAGSMDLRGLREYVVGDEPRHLHWKAFARTGQLMVREFADPAQPWSVVLLDDRATVLSPQAFEEAVEVAASILWEACEQDQPTRLCTASGIVVDSSGAAVGARQVLDRLCTVTQVERGDLDRDAARLGTGRGEGWLALVGGAPEPAMLLAARRFGRAVAFDLGASSGDRPAGVPTIRADSAAEAVRSWNALVAR